MREKANRPPRYPVHIALSYRPVGESEWREGKTNNFSRTGVLFWTHELIKPDTQVEMTFQLPPLLEGEPAARVVCEGRVKRVTGSSALANQLSYVVAITKYKIVRSQSPPKRKTRGSRKEAGAEMN